MNNFLSSSDGERFVTQRKILCPAVVNETSGKTTGCAPSGRCFAVEFSGRPFAEGEEENVFSRLESEPREGRKKRRSPGGERLNGYFVIGPGLKVKTKEHY